jgi:hypothetical protein
MPEKYRKNIETAGVLLALVVALGSPFIVQNTHAQKIDQLERKAAEMDAYAERIESKLNQVSEDVAFIRGRLEVNYGRTK